MAEGDRRHLFYEQMKVIFFAMREIKPEEVDDHTPEEILEASDQLMGVIYKVTGYRFAHVSFRGRTE